jgi:hypothetical protein
VTFDETALEGDGADHTVLQSISVDVLMLENAAQTAFELRYLNAGSSSVEEAKLRFPYDPKMAVSDVILEIGNRTFLSESFETPEAEQGYETHKAARETALLVRRERDSLVIQLALPAGADGDCPPDRCDRPSRALSLTFGVLVFALCSSAEFRSAVHSRGSVAGRVRSVGGRSVGQIFFRFHVFCAICPFHFVLRGEG